MAIQQIKVSLSVQRKLSLAAGLLSAAAYLVTLLGETWGFQGVGSQIAQTALAVNSVISLYFLGSTTQKISEEKKNESKH